MENVVNGNVGVKREFQRFMNRFFYSRDKSVENLSLMYYYLDDMLSYVGKLQSDIGTKLMEMDFEECFLKEVDKKVYYDDELSVILIDAITKKEHDKLNKISNEIAEKKAVAKAKKNG